MVEPRTVDPQIRIRFPVLTPIDEILDNCIAYEKRNTEIRPCQVRDLVDESPGRRKSRRPGGYGAVAQRSECLPVEQEVAGSNPVGSAITDV